MKKKLSLLLVSLILCNILFGWNVSGAFGSENETTECSAEAQGGSHDEPAGESTSSTQASESRSLSTGEGSAATEGDAATDGTAAAGSGEETETNLTAATQTQPGIEEEDSQLEPAFMFFVETVKSNPRITASSFAITIAAGTSLTGKALTFRLHDWTNLDTETPSINIECNGYTVSAPVPSALNADTKITLTISETSGWDPGVYPLFAYANGSDSNEAIARTQVGTLTVSPSIPTVAAVTKRLHKGDAMTQSVHSMSKWWPGLGNPSVLLSVNGSPVSWACDVDGSAIRYTPSAGDLSLGANLVSATLTGNAFNAPKASYELGYIYLSDLSGNATGTGAMLTTIHVEGSYEMSGWQDALPTSVSFQVAGSTANISNVQAGAPQNGANAFSFDYTASQSAIAVDGADLVVSISTTGNTAKNSAFSYWPIGTVRIRGKARPTVSGSNAFCAGTGVSVYQSIILSTSGMFVKGQSTTSVITVRVIDENGQEAGTSVTTNRGNMDNFAVSKNFSSLAPGVYRITAEIAGNVDNEAYGPVDVGYVNVNQLVTPGNLETITYNADRPFTSTFTLNGWQGELPTYTLHMAGEQLASGSCVNGANEVTFTLPRNYATSYPTPVTLTLHGGAGMNQTYSNKTLMVFSIYPNIATIQREGQIYVTQKDTKLVNCPVTFTVSNWNSDKAGEAQLAYLTPDQVNVPVGSVTITGDGTYTAYVTVEPVGTAKVHQLRALVGGNGINSIPWTVVGFVAFKGLPMLSGTLGDYSIHKGEALPNMQVKGILSDYEERAGSVAEIEVRLDGSVVLAKDTSSTKDYQFTIPLKNSNFPSLDYGAHVVTVASPGNDLNMTAASVQVGTIYVTGVIPGNNDFSMLLGDQTIRKATFELPGWSSIPTGATLKVGGTAVTPVSVRLAQSSAIEFVVPASLGIGTHDITVTLPDTLLDKGYADVQIGQIQIVKNQPVLAGYTEKSYAQSLLPIAIDLPVELKNWNFEGNDSAQLTIRVTNGTSTSIHQLTVNRGSAANTQFRLLSGNLGVGTYVVSADLAGNGYNFAAAEHIIAKVSVEADAPAAVAPTGQGGGAAQEKETQVNRPTTIRDLFNFDESDIPLGYNLVFASSHGLTLTEVERLLSERAGTPVKLFSQELMDSLFDSNSQMVLPFDASGIDWQQVQEKGYAIPLVGNIQVAHKRDAQKAIDFDELVGDLVGNAYMRPSVETDAQGNSRQGYVLDVEMVQGLLGGTAGTIQVARVPEDLDIQAAQTMDGTIYNGKSNFKFGEFIPQEAFEGKVVLYISMPCMYSSEIAEQWRRPLVDEELATPFVNASAMGLSAHMLEIIEENGASLSASQGAKATGMR